MTRWLVDAMNVIGTHPDGWWKGELESNATMIAEHLFLLHFLGLRDPETDRLLANEWLTSELSRISARLRSNPGTVRAADLIERLARTGEPVTEG